MRVKKNPLPVPCIPGSRPFFSLTLFSIAKYWALSRNPPPPSPISTASPPFITPTFRSFFSSAYSLPSPILPGSNPPPPVLPYLAAFILNLFPLVIRHFTPGQKKEMFYLQFTLACLRPDLPLKTSTQMSRSCIIWYYIVRFLNWDSIMESSVILKKSTVTAIKMVVSYPHFLSTIKQPIWWAAVNFPA